MWSLLDSNVCGHSECMIGSALDGMCVGLVLTNAAGRIVWVNRTARRMLGETDRDLEGVPLSRVLREPQVAEFWHRALACDETILGDATTRCPRSMELRLNATTSTDQSGELIGRVLLLCDVTRERTVQLKLSEAATLKLIDITEGLREAAPEPVAGLTPAEIRVLRYVGLGLGNVEIAEKLNVAPSTVRSHLKQIYRKTGLTGRSEAISFAIQHGLV